MSRNPVRITYVSKDIPIPDTFLHSDPSDAQPMTFRQIDFAATPLPEYAGMYAAVLDHVLSPSECTTLLRLAEASVGDANRTAAAAYGSPASPWAPALVNWGGGFEVALPDYRNGDRIIWDQQDVVDRLWARLVRVPQVRDGPLLSFAEGRASGGGNSNRNDNRNANGSAGETTSRTVWDFHHVNKRMRFLRYGPGGFFRPHCDAPYGEVAADGLPVLTKFTVHLYLNDSRQEVGAATPDPIGGATSFLSRDERRRLDVDPKAGRVLIFQHRSLYHSGDDVREGVKYTVRTDIAYRKRVAR
ncbi:hypothetical protein GGR54DRAFT_509381 [Hypoxylon sp. NC1633]|nr:hypothetical protein GGR54DRAFT_509381 [Hypoxylon sp. NC1633]